MLGWSRKGRQGRSTRALLAAAALAIAFALAGPRAAAADTPPTMLLPWPQDLPMWLTSGPHDGSFPPGSSEAPPRGRNALDFGRGDENWSVLAVAAGTVVRAGCDLPGSEGLGCMVEIDHGDGWQTLYAHVQADPAKDAGLHVADVVPQGRLLGHAGETGHAYGVHLHFELRRDGWRGDDGTWYPGKAVGIDGLRIDGWTVRAAPLNYEGRLIRRGESVRTANSDCFWWPGSTCARNDVQSTNVATASPTIAAGTAAAVGATGEGFRVLSSTAHDARMTFVDGRGAVTGGVAIDGGGVPSIAGGSDGLTVAWWDGGGSTVQSLAPSGRLRSEHRLPRRPPPLGPLRVAATVDHAVAFVVWEGEPASGPDIYGTILRQDGTASRVFRIAGGAGRQGDPDVAFDATTGAFVVVWSDEPSGTIHAARVGISGTVGDRFAVSLEGAGARSPAISSNGEQLFVTWQQPGRGLDIAGRTITSFGPAGDVVAVATPGGDQVRPSVAWSTAAERWVVAWLDEAARPTGTDLAWRALVPAGQPRGATTLLRVRGSPASPRIACTVAACLIIAVQDSEVVGVVLSPKALR